jgi:GTPase
MLDTMDLNDETKAIRLKQVLLDTDPSTIEDSMKQLVDYIHARLEEGHGEALLDLGLEDNGDAMGFDKKDWDFALARMIEAAEREKSDIRVLMTRNVGSDVEVGPVSPEETAVSGKIMVRHRPETVNDAIETRIAVVGNVDAGKSTMLGVLVKGGLDDGRGKARVNLFRHKHEIESGRTSSVGMEIMGFDSKGNIVTSNTAGRKLSWEEIGQRSV